MSRLTLQTLSIAFVTSIVGLGPLACESSSADAPTAERSVETVIEASPPVARVTPVAPVAAIDDGPVFASATVPTPTRLGSSSAPQPVTPTPTLERKDHPPESLRSPSLLPAGTPELNIAAFTNLPIGKRDKAPLAGAGASGVHLDGLEVGKGWASGQCEDVGGQFVVDVDDRINVCLHVVHPREAEAVTVEWTRDGKVRQTIAVNVKPTHTYSTRAWLPVSSGRVGDWTATVKSDDGTVLGQIAFEIAGPTG